MASFHAGCWHPERGISRHSAITSYAPCTEIALRRWRHAITLGYGALCVPCTRHTKSDVGNDYGTSGSVKKNALPWPCSLWAPITPPWRSTISLQIANPKPVPACDPLLWVKNRSKISARCSGAIPIPRSITSIYHSSREVAPLIDCRTITTQQNRCL